MVLPLLVSCKGGNALVSTEDGDTLHLAYADNLSLVRYHDYVKATVRNPWDTTRQYRLAGISARGYSGTHTTVFGVDILIGA